MDDLITGLVSDVYNWYRKWKADQVHVEAYWRDDVWKAIEEVDYSDASWYVMTPVNYDYFRNYIGTKISKKKMNEIMSRRVQELNRRYNLELHIHFWWMKQMPTEKKCLMFDEALNWADEHGISFSEFVPGWWNYDDDLEKLCDEFGLNLVKRGFAVHDYEFLEDE